jgi:hypothetical protein
MTNLARILAGKKNPFAPPEYDPEEEQVAPPAPVFAPTQDDSEVDNMFKEGPAAGDYKHHLDSMPDEKDYKLGKLGNLAAIFAGATQGFNSGSAAEGLKVTEGLRDKPYKEAFSKWNRQESGKRNLVNIEEKEQGNRIRAFDYKSKAKDRSEDNARADAAQEGLNLYRRNQSEQARRNGESLEKYRERMASSAASRAKSGERTASAAEMSAGARRMDAETRRSKLNKSGVPQPKIGDQRSSETMALQDIATERPEYRKFIKQNPRTGRMTVDLNAAVSDPENYSTFNWLVKNRASKRLGTLDIPLDGNGGEGDDRYEVLDDEE